MEKEKIRERVSELKETWTFRQEFKKTRYRKTPKLWEKEDKFRVYVPRDAYEDAGYISLYEDVYGHNSGEYRGMYYQANRPGNINVLRSYIDDILGAEAPESSTR